MGPDATQPPTPTDSVTSLADNPAAAYRPVLCPYCATTMPDASFALWGRQTFFVTATCRGCAATVTLPTRPDGTVNGDADALGNGQHAATREGREREGLASRR